MATSSARLDELKKKFDENPRRYFAPLANEYRKLGDLTQAIALCRAHLPNQPGHISGHIVLAQALYEARELGESRGIFEAALDLDPENLIALRYLGDIAREQGEPLQARGWYERVLDADPRNDEIASLLKALDAESARVSEAVAPSVAASGYEQESAAALADFPVDTTPAAPALFFGEVEAAPPAAGELEAVAEPSIDDWFATPELPAAPASSTEDVAALAHASDSDLEASLGFESTSLDETATAPADGLEESFFPDLASVTPPGSPLIPGVPTPVDVHAVTPPFLLAQAEVAKSIPTPPFLQSIAEEPVAAEQAEIPVTLEFSEVASDEGEPAGVPAMESLGIDVPSEASPHSADAGEWELSASDFDVAEPVAAAPAEAPATPAQAEWELTPDAPSTEPALANAEEFASFDEPGRPESVVAADESEAWELSADFESAAPIQAATPDAESSAAIDPGEFGFVASDSFAGEPSDDIEVEYGEFVAPAADEVPYIANSISVPLDDADAYSAGAPELSAHEPFPIEAQYRPEDQEADATLHTAPTPAWNEAVESEIDSAPIEGLEQHDIEEYVGAEEEPSLLGAVEESEAEGVTAFADQASEQPAAAAAGTPFVTETMAELYLQQGFADEALAIYRQLLAQQPGDESLAHRVSALERGSHSAVVDGIAPRDHTDRLGQSVRGFFAHFARRQPRHSRGAKRQDDEAESSDPHDGRSAQFSGVATREEALTVPDEQPQAVGTASTLAQLFQAGQVSSADDSAASALANAFGGDGADGAGRAGDGQLSLEHLFRDVPARSSGAVTLDEFYEGSSPREASEVSGGAGGESDADIEQFTAWLEGLKKK
jgi:tetratricopeptide (TPR) repeat protein